MAMTRVLLVFLLALGLTGCCVSMRPPPPIATGPLAAWDGLGDRPDQSPSFQRHRIQKARDAKAYASDTDGLVPPANALALASEEVITDEVENRRMAKAVIICHACELGVVTRADMKTAYLSKRRARIVRKLLDTWRPPPQARPYANAR